MKDGRNLFINNRRLRAFDPIYRMEEATHASIAVLSEKRSRLVQSWTIPIPVEEESPCVHITGVAPQVLQEDAGSLISQLQ